MIILYNSRRSKEEKDSKETNMGGKVRTQKPIFFGIWEPHTHPFEAFFQKKFQVKVVKVGCALTNVKSAPTKFERQKVFSSLVTYMLYHCAVIRSYLSGV